MISKTSFDLCYRITITALMLLKLSLSFAVFSPCSCIDCSLDYVFDFRKNEKMYWF